MKESVNNILPSSSKVYQLKIHLLHISPMIWRRFQVKGDTNIAQLHFIIQLIMGWEDYHLHKFKIRGKDYGVTRSYDMLLSNPLEISLDSLKLRKNWKFYYIYNFGNQWKHEIRIEFISEEITLLKFPICISGKRACPPENILGSSVYPQFLIDVFWFQTELREAILEDLDNFAKNPKKWVNMMIDECKLDHSDEMWSYATFEKDAFDKKKVNEKLRKLYQKKGDDIEGMTNVVQEVCQKSFYLV